MGCRLLISINIAKAKYLSEPLTTGFMSGRKMFLPIQLMEPKDHRGRPLRVFDLYHSDTGKYFGRVAQYLTDDDYVMALSSYRKQKLVTEEELSNDQNQA